MRVVGRWPFAAATISEVDERGKDVSSGIYLYKISDGNSIITKKMTILQ